MANLLYAHSVGVIGGAERVTMDMMSGLAAQHSIAMICPKGPLSEQSSQYLSKHINCDFHQPDWRHPLRTIQTQLALKTHLQSLKPDVIHCGDILAIRYLQRMAKHLNIPLICHVHYPYETPFMRWAFKNTDIAAFIYCSQELQTAIGEELANQCPAAQHHVVHNGVDLERFVPSNSPLSDVVQIGIVGNLQERKGHIDFIDMAATILAKDQQAQFHIIGGDILGEKRMDVLKQHTSARGITDNVVFHGQLSDVSKAIANLDIVVCASHTEAFPLTILEAMASQKAIVTTNVNGIPEATGNDGDCALLAPPHCPDKLAELCVALITNPAQRQQIAINARKRVEEHFSKQIFVKKIGNIYDGIISAHDK